MNTVYLCLLGGRSHMGYTVFIQLYYTAVLPNFLSDKEVEKNWKHQRELFATSNIIFPAYQPEGMLFKLHEDVDSKNNIPLGLIVITAKAIKTIIGK